MFKLDLLFPDGRWFCAFHAADDPDTDTRSFALSDYPTKPPKCMFTPTFTSDQHVRLRNDTDSSQLSRVFGLALTGVFLQADSHHLCSTRISIPPELSASPF